MENSDQTPNTPQGGKHDQVADLVTRLKQGNASARREAIRELRKLGSVAADALPALREAYDPRLIDSNRDFYLQCLPHDEVEAALAYIELFQDLDARSIGFTAILKVPRDAQYAIPTLLKVLREEDGGWQSWAVSALSVIGRGDPEVIGAIVGVLKSTDRGFSNSVACTLSCFGAEVVPYLQGSLADPTLHEFAVRAMFCEETAKATPTPELIKALRDDDPPLRKWAAWCLARTVGSGRDITPLAAAIHDVSEVALMDEDPDTAENALYVLYSLYSQGERDAFDYLFEALLSDDAIIRQRALQSFRPMIIYRRMLSTSAEVHGAFRKALQDESPHVRWEAIESLRLAGVPALPVLIAALENNRAEVRRLAAQALGQGVAYWELSDRCMLDTSKPKITDALATSARMALTKALSDEVPAVREAALDAMQRFCEKNGSSGNFANSF